MQTSVFWHNLERKTIKAGPPYTGAAGRHSQWSTNDQTEPDLFS